MDNVVLLPLQSCPILNGSLVTKAWHVLRLQMEKTASGCEQ
jgi:hypothetical protein